MPVYLCVPGSNSPEPWRHGIPVYALPFPFDSSTQRITTPNTTNEHNSSTNTNNDNDTFPTTHENNVVNNTLHNYDNNNNSHTNDQMHQYEDDNDKYTTHTGGVNSMNNNSNSSSSWNIDAVLSAGRQEPIRRVKHAEIVLVDEVDFYHGNYWLRLRWPGRKGGVAGYIPLGGVNVIPIDGVRNTTDMVVTTRSHVEDGPSDRVSDVDGGRRGGTTTGGVSVLNSSERIGGEKRDRNLRFLQDGPSDRVSDVDGGRRGGTTSGGVSVLNSSERIGGEKRDRNLRFLQDGICTVADNTNPSYNSDQERSFPEEEGDDLEEDLLECSHPPADLPHQSYSRMIKCESTRYYFPSTEAMKLLPDYDDGLSALQDDSNNNNMLDDVDGASNSGEPVFCRICRDGLHDVDDEPVVEGDKKGKGQDNAAGGGGSGRTVVGATLTSANLEAVNNDQIQGGFKRHSAVESTSEVPPDNDSSERPYMMQNHLLNNSLQYRDQLQSDMKQEKETVQETKQPIKAEQRNHPYAENPLLSPCECSGSMAFVHYLCIEQWRCRSNHPDARNGLNCETCKAPYTLPPPPSRPEAEEEEWLEAMPPHVHAALRNPHLGWQVGAAIVRRRWLRPIAPIITSPIVALYCRARRSLKKRGVSRRRWACSLCGRRARWKCVRCLRSYYCSRQCQNVSWHIVHKHVCYKPQRFWWSVVVYGFAYVYFIPGVLSYPLIYDLGLGMLWMSFVLMGVIAGGIATIMKREVGIDIRGRTLELSVVLMTLWMAWVGWCLIWSFFGVDGSDQCVGVMDKMDGIQSSIGIPIFGFSKNDSSGAIDPSPSREQRLVQNLLLKPTSAIINYFDRALSKTPKFAYNWICSPVEGSEDLSNQSCLHLVMNMNPEFMLDEFDGQKCASDFNLMVHFGYFAGFVHALGTVWKQRRDRVRRQRHHPRPHQD